MYHAIQLISTIPSVRKSNSRSPWRRGFLLIPFVIALACFAFSPTARAVLPPPDGFYSNQNTAEGQDALFSLTTGYGNTATGYQALYGNTSGNENTATGTGALSENTTGSLNTATGFGALESNTTGSSNTANGNDSLEKNTTGSFNTAYGDDTLQNNIKGGQNTAIGASALQKNTGSSNTALGNEALEDSTTGSWNIALGNGAGLNITTGSNNIDIGNAGVDGDSAKIRIGKQGTQNGTFIAGISGVALTGSTVVVNSSGKLGVATSSARFKQGVKPMDKASEAILALKPVSFRYKEEIDPDGVPQFGLIAEEVEKVNPDLVGRDEAGKVNTVRYEAVNAMLLNEFLKEHQKVQRLEAVLAAVNERLKAQDAKIDKVNAKVELTKPAPQMVANNR